MANIIRIGGGAAAEKPALPVLDETYPADANVEYVRGNSASATFSVSIALAGVPAEYTYQWYMDDAPVDGETGETYTVSGALEAGTKAIYCKVTNRAGTVQSRTATLSVNVLYPPDLESALPADVTGIQYNTTSAMFSVGIASAGNPDEYTYQWYMDDAPVDGETGSSYTFSDFTSVATHSVYCKVTNRAGTVQSRTATMKILTYKPTYSYSGTSAFTDEGNGNWNLKLKSSGTLNFSKLDTKVDVFLVGGGGGGGNTDAGGGGGGYTKTSKGISVTKGSNYTITVGAGGASTSTTGGNGSRGGTTSAFGVSASGGYGGKGNSNGYTGGNGGSAGGAGGSSWLGVGGSDGGNGEASKLGSGGTGQGTTTREFGLSSGTLYAGGGGGGCDYNSGGMSGGSGGGGRGRNYNVALADCHGKANTGGGGGGGAGSTNSTSVGGTGGSGIVVIRNAR